MNNLRSDLPLLYDFYRVASFGNISKASENYISQSNLSRNIRNLEDRMSLVLINRTNKGITLTNDGEQLFKKLNKIFINLDTFQSNLTDNTVGNIVIGSTRNIADNILSECLTGFYMKFPKIHLQIITDSATNLNKYLMAGKIDVLFDYLPNINYSKNEELIVRPFSEFQTCFACSQKFYSKIKNNIRYLKDLNRYLLIIPGSSRRRQMLDEVLQVNNVKLSPIVEMPDSKLMIEFVSKVDCLGYFIKNEIINENLVPLEIKEKLPTNKIGIIYSNHSNMIIKNFVDYIFKES